MKKSELKQLIKEEIAKALNERRGTYIGKYRSPRGSITNKYRDDEGNEYILVNGIPIDVTDGDGNPRSPEDITTDVKSATQQPSYSDYKRSMGKLYEKNITEDHKPGDEVLYMGKKYIVVDEDEYIIKLKDPKTGDIKKVNYSQFKSRTMNESLYPLTTQVDKIADLMAQHNIGVDSINFVRSGKASEPWLEALVRRLESNGVDVSSIKAQPKSPQDKTSNPKPSIDPYEFFTPSKGYMGSSYRGD